MSEARLQLSYGKSHRRDCANPQSEIDLFESLLGSIEDFYVPTLLSARKMRKNINRKSASFFHYFESPCIASDKGPLPLVAVIRCPPTRAKRYVVPHRKSFVSLYSAINLQGLSQQHPAQTVLPGHWRFGGLGVGGPGKRLQPVCRDKKANTHFRVQSALLANQSHNSCCRLRLRCCPIIEVAWR